MKKMTMVKVFNVSKKEDGEELISRLEELVGDNFYELNFILSPAGGSLDIFVQTNYEFTDEYGDPSVCFEKELHSVVNSLLISGIYLGR